MKKLNHKKILADKYLIIGISLVMVSLIIGFLIVSFRKVDLGEGYYKNYYSVYFLDEKLEGRHALSFEVLDDRYTKEKNHVYFLREILENIDPKGFEIIDKFYTKNNDHVYYKNNKVEDANPDNFVLMENFYAKDDDDVFLAGQKKGNDLDKFSTEFATFKKKEDGIYFIRSNIDADDTKIEDVDLETFEVLDNNHAKDKNYFYCNGTDGLVMLEDIDYETLEIIDGLYFKDKNNVYHQCSRILDADPKTFRSLSWSYKIDKNYVYRLGEPIIKDIETFEVLDDEMEVTKDKNGVYYYNKDVGVTDPESFKILNHDYSKDNYHVYKIGNVFDKSSKPIIVEGVDAQTFELFSSDSCGSHAKDKNNIYYLNCGGKITIVEEADVNSFTYIGNGYGKDKDNIFRTDKKHSFVFDLETFQTLGGGYLKDKNGIYRYVCYKGRCLYDKMDVDYDSFVVLKDGYAKDKNNCFKNDYSLPSNYKTLNLSECENLDEK